jgi:hypothetical protein
MSSPAKRIAWILWLFFLGWMVLFTVLWWRGGQGPGVERAEVGLLLALSAAGVVQVLLSVLINRSLYSSRLSEWTCRKQKAMEVGPDEMKRRAMAVLSPVFVLLNVLCWAINTSLCVNGLALAMMGMSAAASLPFICAGVLLQVFTLPRPGTLETNVHRCFDVELTLESDAG